jgi:hypothetical protein
VPLTYLSHQAAVLPLKMWRPAWFDGTALVFGSMAPDWAYVLNRSRFAFDAHVWPAAAWFALPASVLVTVVVRRQEMRLLAALPWQPVWLRHLARCAPRRRSLSVVVACAALGVLTHIGWDAFTHDFRWGAQHVAWLRERVTIGGRTMSHAHLLQQISTVGGALVTILLLVVIGRRRSVLDWRPQQRAALRSRPDRRVYAVSAVAAAVGLAWAGDVHGDLAAAINRLVLTAGAGYVAAVSIFTTDTDTATADDSEEQT